MIASIEADAVPALETVSASATLTLGGMNHNIDSAYVRAVASSPISRLELDGRASRVRTTHSSRCS